MKKDLSAESKIRLNAVASSLRNELFVWARSLKLSDQQMLDLLDGRNRDDYEASFGRWLQRPREFASND